MRNENGFSPYVDSPELLVLSLHIEIRIQRSLWLFNQSAQDSEDYLLVESVSSTNASYKIFETSVHQLLFVVKYIPFFYWPNKNKVKVMVMLLQLYFTFPKITLLVLIG